MAKKNPSGDQDQIESLSEEALRGGFAKINGKPIEGFISDPASFSGVVIMLKEPNSGGEVATDFWFRDTAMKYYSEYKKNGLFPDGAKENERYFPLEFEGALRQIFNEGAYDRLRNAAYCNLSPETGLGKTGKHYKERKSLLLGRIKGIITEIAKSSPYLKGEPNKEEPTFLLHYDLLPGLIGQLKKSERDCDAGDVLISEYEGISYYKLWPSGKRETQRQRRCDCKITYDIEEGAKTVTRACTCRFYAIYHPSRYRRQQPILSFEPLQPPSLR